MEINADNGACLPPHPCHLQPSVPKGSTSHLIGPLHPLESKLSSDLPAWNDPFRFISHNPPPSFLIRIPAPCVCVGSDACNFTIPVFFLPWWKKKWEKKEKKGRSENSRRYYSAACMAPAILSFHLSFLLYWQMVVIRQYGNTVV